MSVSAGRFAWHGLAIGSLRLFQALEHFAGCRRLTGALLSGEVFFNIQIF